MKTLGIVGGIAPASTIDYYRMLFAAYQARVPDGSAPPVIINSIDMQTMLRLIAADALDEVTTYLAGGTVDSISTTADGRILMLDWDSREGRSVRRLRPDGSPDPTFGSAGKLVL